MKSGVDKAGHSPQLREIEPTLSVKGDFGDLSSASGSGSFGSLAFDEVGSCHTRNNISSREQLHLWSGNGTHLRRASTTLATFCLRRRVDTRPHTSTPTPQPRRSHSASPSTTPTSLSLRPIDQLQTEPQAPLTRNTICTRTPTCTAPSSTPSRYTTTRLVRLSFDASSRARRLCGID